MFKNLFSYYLLIKVFLQVKPVFVGSRFLFFAFFFWLCNFNILQAKPLSLDGSLKERIGKEFSVYLDASNQLNFEEVLNLEQEKWELYDQETLNFGITDSRIWILLKVKNISNSGDLVLDVGAPAIDKIHFYFVSGDSIFKDFSGDEIYPRKHNQISPIFPLPIAQDQEGIILISLEGHEIIEVPLSIGSREAILESIQKKNFFQGGYFGLILVMAVYNLFLFFNLRDFAYIFYVIYVSFLGFTAAYLSGYISNLHLCTYGNLLSSLGGIFGTLFSIFFLDSVNNSKWIHRILVIYLFYFFFTIVFEFFGSRHLNTNLVYMGAISSSFFLLFSGAYVYLKKGFLQARYFTISWFAFILGLNIQMLRVYGFLDYNLMTSHALQVGNVLEVVLLSFALADRINQYKKEHEESKERAISALNSNRKLIEEQKRILEEKVKERTSIIEKQNQELEQKNKNLTKELELAGKFQHSLLPNKPIHVPRVSLAFLYEPMLGVGGDFIDILYESNKEKLGLFICDVTGHGVTASLIASMVKISLQDWASLMDSPIKIPEILESRLKGKLDKNFITAGICTLDLNSLALTYVSAGHPPAIRIDKSGKGEYIQLKGRVIMESFFPSNYESKTVQLSGGDKFILYTDGVWEIRSPSGEMLGEERFLRKMEDLSVLAPREVVGEVSAFLKEFSGGMEPLDDITLLYLEVEY